MASLSEVTEIDIGGRTFWVRPVGSWVLDSGNVVAEGPGGIAGQAIGMGRRVLLRQRGT